MQAYLQEGERRAFELGNRGPIRFTEDGKLHPAILEAYWRCGFYVFEGVLKPDELADIDAVLAALKARAIEHKYTLTIGRSHKHGVGTTSVGPGGLGY